MTITPNLPPPSDQLVETEQSYQPSLIESCQNLFISFYYRRILGINVDEQLKTSLHSHQIKTLDIEEIEWCLRIGANPQTQNDIGDNLLHIASKTANLALLQLALKHSVALTTLNHAGLNPLQENIQATHSPHSRHNIITLEYLKHIPNLYDYDKGNFEKAATHLFYTAFDHSSKEVIEKIGDKYFQSPGFEKLDKEKKKALVNMLLRSFIYNASKSPKEQFYPLVERCLKEGANAKAYYQPQTQSTLLHHCRAQGYNKIGYLLMQYGADPFAKDTQGRVPSTN